VVTTPAPSRLRAASSAARSLPSLAVAFFSGPVGLAVKIALLAIMNALSVWAAVVLVDHHKWVAVAVLALVTAIIDWIYLTPRAYPAKFLLPGTIFLIAFQVIPVIYTVQVAFTNYSTGHVLTKSEAVTQIRQNSFVPADNGRTFTMAPARDDKGHVVLLMVDQNNGKAFVGTSGGGLAPLAAGSVKKDIDGVITSAPGYTIPQGPDRLALATDLNTFVVHAGSSEIQPQGLDSAVEVRQTLRYDSAHNRFVRISDGALFTDSGRGSFVSGSGEAIEPGWRTGIGFANFGQMIHDPLVRGPFLRVFVWTVAFAALTVLFSFSLGLFLAITLDKPGMRFQRFYRSALIIPYAIPGVLSLLVWQGLLNDDFGVINKSILHTQVPWLFDANWARVSVIVVSTWLTAPYFFLVSLGALQSIPQELTEAARVDGAGAWQNFRKVTLPLLLVAVTPLMIASFAFNFNNFGSIYLLTGGGPSTSDGSVAGATDILISYTYKLAFVVGKGTNYGLASAIAILIFFIVAGISWISFSRTKALENLA